MDNSVDIRISFAGGAEIPVQLASPFALKYTQGTDPYYFSIVTNDITQFPDAAMLRDGAKCSFKFSTPGANGGRVTKTLDGWYLVRIEPARAENGNYIVTFADERWKLQYRKYTKQYNIRWPDGSYRNDSVPGGSGRTGSIWRAKDALEDFLTDAGYKPDFTRLHSNKRHIFLSNNLGNSVGGGWVDAGWDEVVVPMLELLDAHIYFIDGQPHITDRNGDIAKNLFKLRAIPRIVDTVGKSLNDWEKPRILRVGFEIKLEASLDSEAPRTSSFRPIFDTPENVMPRLTPQDRVAKDWWDAIVGEQRDTEWNLITDEVAVNGSASPLVLDMPLSSEVDAVIGRNYFLPQVFPFRRREEGGEILEGATPALNAQAIEIKLWYSAQAREHWHRTYRIKYVESSDPNAPTFRSLSGLRFGRLTPGGDTISRGNVFMDWCEETTQGMLPNGARSMFDAQFSRNHAYDPERPAPFVAEWIAESGNELIFRINPVNRFRMGLEEIFPGQFSKPLTYVDPVNGSNAWFSMVSEDFLNAHELLGQFDSDIEFRIILSGRLVAEPFLRGALPSYGRLVGRRLVVEVPLFANGAIESMEAKEHSITANFGFSKDQLASTAPLGDNFPSVFLNEEDVRQKVEDLQSLVMERFSLGESGGILFPGVEPLASNIYPGGDIYETSVVVGDPDPWSITTQYIILPGMPGPAIDPKDRDGMTPQFIDTE